jgi:hypothetical protein
VKLENFVPAALPFVSEVYEQFVLTEEDDGMTKVTFPGVTEARLDEYKNFLQSV